ncbi:unnamed protein product [Closterium sp. NIES-53]
MLAVNRTRRSQHRSFSPAFLHRPPRQPSRPTVTCSPLLPPSIRRSLPKFLRSAPSASPPCALPRQPTWRATHRPFLSLFPLVLLAGLLISLAPLAAPLAPNPWPREYRLRSRCLCPRFPRLSRLLLLTSPSRPHTRKRASMIVTFLPSLPPFPSPFLPSPIPPSVRFFPPFLPPLGPPGTGVPRYTVRAGEKGHCPYVRPLYACERNNRPDSRYQRYRWHAKKCRLSYFSGSGFKYLMRQRRMLLVGDSIMGNLFEALLCAIHAAGYQGKPFVRKTKGPFNIKGVRFPRFSFSLEFLFSPYLVHARQRTSINRPQGGGHGYIVNVDRIDPTLASVLPRYDVVVFSSGVWWSQNVPGRSQPNFFRVDGQRRNLTNLAAYSWGLATINRHLGLSNFPGVPMFLSFSPRHTGHGMPQPWVTEAYRGGTWSDFQKLGRLQSGPHLIGSCGALTPMKRSGLVDRYNFGSAELFYAMQRATLKGSFMRLLKITRLSQSRPDGHLGVWYEPRTAEGPSSPIAMGLNPFDGDCTHWCLPGVPDAWVDILYNHLLLEPLLFARKNDM